MGFVFLRQQATCQPTQSLLKGSLPTYTQTPYWISTLRRNLLGSLRGVQSIFWIHVSQTREGFNPPIRPSLRRGSNSNQTRNIVCMAELTALPRLSDIGSTCLTGNPFGVSSVLRNELPSLVWMTLDPCLSDGLSGGFNPPFVCLTWIQKNGLYYTWEAFCLCLHPDQNQSGEIVPQEELICG